MPLDPSSSEPCAEHPEAPGRYRCSSCARWLCTECWRFNVDGLPWCSACVELVKDAKDRFPASFALSCVVIAGACAFLAFRREIFGIFPALLMVALVAALAVAVAPWLGRPASGLARKIVAVVPDEPPRRDAPWANAGRRALRIAVPSWSGTTTVVVLLASFAFAAALVPKVLRLRRFVEAEAVIATWWLSLATVLTILLYRGARLGDDHRFRVRRLDVRGFFKAIPNAPESLGRSGCDGCVDFEGCAYGIGVLAVAAVAISASWVLAEVMFPALFLVAYSVLLRALGRVTNNPHDCRGHLTRSLGWAFAWSTLYSLPLALLPPIFHFIQLR